MQREFLLGLAGLMAISVWACGDDEDATGAGGAGGTGSTTTTSQAAPGVTASSSAMATTGTGMMTTCSEACFKMAETCQLGSTFCPINGNLGFADLNTCTGTNPECLAQCVLDDACNQVEDLFGPITAPADVLACVAACYPPCLGCVIENCDGERNGASQDGQENGRPYLACLAECQANDTTCAAMCATNNAGSTTTAVDTCAQANCMTECF